MADQKKTEKAKVVFDTVCRTLDNSKWSYKKNEEKLIVECGAQGDDLPIQLTIRVDVERQLVLLLSNMPFVIQEDKRIDTAVAISAINNFLVDGSFDYNVASGRVFFRMTNSYIDSDISEEVFLYMVLCSCKTVDEYNDKFLMISKGILPIDKFVSEIYG